MGKVYKNKRWFEFSEKIKARDGYKCLKCGRGKEEVVLNVHNTNYIRGIDVCELQSSYYTLCNSCNAKEHGIIEPTSGWYLISIDDLGGLDGICEREGCVNKIRYAHLVHHPNWGYKTVGSTCVEFLTEEDQYISAKVLKVLKNIQKFINSSVWEENIAKNNKRFISATYSYNKIRIYGQENNFSYQLWIKKKGIKWYDYDRLIKTENKSLEQVKELSYIVLKGKLATDFQEKEILREIYRNAR